MPKTTQKESVISNPAQKIVVTLIQEIDSLKAVDEATKFACRKLLVSSITTFFRIVDTQIDYVLDHSDILTENADQNFIELLSSLGAIEHKRLQNILSILISEHGSGETIIESQSKFSDNFISQSLKLFTEKIPENILEFDTDIDQVSDLGIPPLTIISLIRLQIAYNPHFLKNFRHYPNISLSLLESLMLRKEVLSNTDQFLSQTKKGYLINLIQSMMSKYSIQTNLIEELELSFT